MLNALVLVLLSAVLCGCATMRFPRAYKVDGKEYAEFKDLDDEKALKVIAGIYNVQPENWEESVAKGITLDQYLTLLAKRKSRTIRESGIFNLKYDKVKLSSWKEGDLAKVYDALTPKADEFYNDSSCDLTERQNARRIVYLTAVNAISKELKNRSNAGNAIALGGQALATVLMVALSMV